MKLRVVPMVVVVALLAAACGGGEAATDGVASLSEQEAAAPDDSEDVAADDVDMEQALLDFAACMREQGIDMDDPVVGGDGNVIIGRPGSGSGGDTDRETMQAAREVCSEHLEQVTLGFRRGDDSEFQDLLYEYAACMRENGVEMDDPDFSGAGSVTEGEAGQVRGGPFGALDPDDPTFQAAQDVCGEILGGFGPGGSVRVGEGPADGAPPGGGDE